MKQVLVGGCDWSIYTSVTQGLPKARERHWATWAFARSATGRQIGTLRRCHWYIKGIYSWNPYSRTHQVFDVLSHEKGSNRSVSAIGTYFFFRRGDMHLDCISSTIVKWKCMRGILGFQTSDTVAIVAKEPQALRFSQLPLSTVTRFCLFHHEFLDPFFSAFEKACGTHVQNMCHRPFKFDSSL